MTEKMPSSSKFGSRPRALRMRSYSSGARPCSAIISGVMRGASRTSRGSPVGFIIYTEDVDSAFKKAIAAGGTEALPVENQFWGDRMGTLTDPLGHKWSIATHVEDVPPEQFQERMAASQAKQKQPETV